MRSIILLKAVFVLLVIAGCATIMHGTGQDIGISSKPTGAQVFVDNQPKGTTPVAVDMKRKDKHIVRIEMEGYQPYEITIIRKTSGWVWGNIVFGGLIGLAVDAITGGLYKLNPEQVMGELAQKPTGAEIKNGVIYVTLISSPDKSRMTKIGDLVPRTIEP